MKECRSCKHVVSEDAFSCPNCGAPYPAIEKWDGWGFEYKSRTTLFGLPLIHISFKYRPNQIGAGGGGGTPNFPYLRWLPVPAKGIISIGQFGIGVINISQFGIGFVSISQFTVAVYAVAQIAVAYSLIAQIGLYIDKGYGQIVRCIPDLIK